ncbi:MAG: hypothetical protein FJ088_12070, partial [Deltaproteobacteria bacterium]|nr:hypothetical protein [Deltaproteobacteria bacterium]
MIEFVTGERWVYPSRLYPFIKGCSEKLGIDVLWICFGTEITIEKTGKADVIQYVKLSGQEESFLEEQIRRLETTHLIINYPISSTLLKRIREAAGGRLNILSMSDLQSSDGVMRIQDLVISARNSLKATKAVVKKSADNGEREASQIEKEVMQTNWLLRWLGEDKERSSDFDRYIVGTIRPSYDVVMGNDRAREFKPHIMIIGGILCDHFPKVKNDPLYKDIDLSPCTQDYGCTYCTHYRKPVSDMHIDPVSIAEEQFRRIIETAGANGRSFGYFDIYDIRLFRKIDLFFEMILRLEVPPATFFFEPRIDRFLEVADKLDAVLPKLAAAGHVVSIFRMGAESLVEEENVFY